VNLENSQSPIPVGSIHGNPSIKATWTQQGYVESIRPVGSADNYNGLVGVKTVHFHQQLV